MTSTTSRTSDRSTQSARPRLALTALCLAFFVVQLDVTIMNVALQTVGQELGGGLGDQQWVVAGYTVALAAGTLTAGSLGDRYGARRICGIGLVVFAVASALCSLAPDMSTLIGARVLQGVGAAALLPCSLSLIVQQFPERRARARALGVWGGIASVGMAAGPVVGGALIALTGWRAVFLVNVPFCAVTLALTWLWVREAPRRPRTTLDVRGLVLGTVALSAVTGGLIEAGRLGWGQPVPLALVVGGLLAGAAFLVVERRGADPLLPLDVFGSRPFSAGTVAGGIFNFCAYGALLCISLFLQGPLGEDAFAAGMLILPLTLAIGAGATLSGRLTARFGPRAPMLLGYGAGAAGAALLACVGPSGPLWLVVLGSVVLGLCSVAMPAMTSVVMSAVEPSRTGLASGVLNTARQAGGALGAAVLGTLLSVGGGLLLRVPMIVVIVAYAVAVGATLAATPKRP